MVWDTAEAKTVWQLKRGATSHAAPIRCQVKAYKGTLSCVHVRGTAIIAAPSLPPAGFGLGTCESL